MKGTLDERLTDLQQLYPVWKKTTIFGCFEATARRFPENDFVVQEHCKTYTYRQALAETRRMAAALSKAGVRAGAHVAIQMTNCAEQIFAGLALSMLGAVKIPVNIALGSYELNYVLNQSDAAFFISAYAVLLQPQANRQRLKTVLLIGDGACEAAGVSVVSLAALLADEALPDGQALDRLAVGAEYADKPSDIIYTSGSTGSPKGVVLTHDMLLRSAFANCLNRGFELGRRIYVPLPLFHCYGYIEGLLAAILVGGAVLLRFHKFTAPEAVRFMQDYRANDILSVPSLMITLIRHLETTPAALPELHAVYCSATVCPAWVWPGIRQHLQVDDLITGYGMTEVCGASMQTRPTDSDERLRTRVGKLLPGGCSGLAEYGGRQMEYRVMDAQTQTPCPPEESGELWCRGVTVTKGYYNNAEANEKAFTADGWFRTGDVGRFDEDGYLLLEGRTNDIYKINGENVSPKFLEDVIGNCGVVAAVEIVGIPSVKYGAIGVAFVQLKEDNTQNRETLEQYCHNNLARFQLPRHYFYMKPGSWPLTATGKVQKPQLRRIAAEKLGELS